MDLTDVNLAALMESKDSNLALAVQRVRDEADRGEPRRGVSAFNSSLM